MSNIETLTVGGIVYGIESSINLVDLADVEITNLQNGDHIEWSSEKQKYVNKPSAGGGSELVADNVIVSTDTAYASGATLLNPFNYDVILVRLTAYGTSHDTIIPVDKTMSSTRQNFTAQAHVPVKMYMTSSTVGSTEYGGSEWTYIYCSMYGYNFNV